MVSDVDMGDSVQPCAFFVAIKMVLFQAILNISTQGSGDEFQPFSLPGKLIKMIIIISCVEVHLTNYKVLS